MSKQLKRKIDLIEEKFANYFKKPETHCEYEELRIAFLSKAYNKLAYGINIEREFAKQFLSHLEKLKQIEINIIRDSFKIDDQSNNLSDLSTSEEEFQKNDKDIKKTIMKLYDTQIKEIHSALKTKYLGFYQHPETHDDFSYYWQRFLANNEGLQGAKQQREWRKYWDSKVDERFDEELSSAKRRVWKELEEKKESKSQVRSLINPIFGRRSSSTSQSLPVQTGSSSALPVTTSTPKISYSEKLIPTPPMISNLISVVPPRPSGSSFEESRAAASKYASEIENKFQQVKQEPIDVKIPASSMSELLKNYDLRVNKMLRYVNESFDKYTTDANAYPEILQERRSFLNTINDSGISSEDLIFQFHQKFQEHWIRRLEDLKIEAIDKEKENIQMNWRDLVADYTQVVFDDAEKRLKRQSTESEEIFEKRRKLDAPEKQDDLSVEVKVDVNIVETVEASFPQIDISNDEIIDKDINKKSQILIDNEQDKKEQQNEKSQAPPDIPQTSNFESTITTQEGTGTKIDPEVLRDIKREHDGKFKGNIKSSQDGFAQKNDMRFLQGWLQTLTNNEKNALLDIQRLKDPAKYAALKAYLKPEDDVIILDQDYVQFSSVSDDSDIEEVL